MELDQTKQKGGGDLMVLMMASSASHPGLLNAVDSLKLQGYRIATQQIVEQQKHHQYRVLGLGEQWGGWRHRMRTYRDAAAELTQLDPLAVVVCMDAYDAICLRSAGDGLLDTFRSFGKPLVLSLERVCIGNCVSIRDWWETDGTPHLRKASLSDLPEDRYVNGGLVMGYAWAIQKLYDWMLNINEADDQRGLGRYALAHRDHWAPDIQGRIFKNKLYGDPLTSADLSGQGAYFAHFPGLPWNGITSYDLTVNAVLKRPSNVKCTNLGTPKQFAAKIVALILAIVLLVVALVLITRALIFSKPTPSSSLTLNRNN
jgi:hypothetical protein